MNRRRYEKILTSFACIAPFCIAMALRDVVNIWLGTTTAAAISIPLPVAEIQTSGARWHRNLNLARAIVGVGVGLAMAGATWALYPLAVSIVPELETKVGWLYQMLRQHPGPAKAFLLLLAVVLAEELVWRGVLMDWLLPRFGIARAVMFSSLLYVLPQVAFRSLTLVAVAFACGVVWSTLRATTRSIWPPLLAHLVWDVLVFVAYPLS